MFALQLQKRKSSTKMQLSNIAILALRGLDKEAKQRIADVAGVSIDSIYRWINTNNDNLTKPAIIRVIKKELNLADDQEILEESDSETVKA